MDKKNSHYLQAGMAILLLASMLVLSKNAALMVMTDQITQKEKIVVIDAGHGDGYLRSS